MVTIEIRYDGELVKVRRFGSGEFKRWTALQPGEVDRLTGWSHSELKRLGDGIWEFPAAPALSTVAA